MVVARYIKKQGGADVDLSTIRSGHILSNCDADDYGFKTGETYEIKFNSGTQLAYIDPDGQIDLDGEIRPDILGQLVWIDD